MDPYQALLLQSFGGPEQAQDVMPFLERVTAGRGIPRRRIEAVAEHYYANGGASPINDQCRQLLANLGPALQDLGLSLYWGNRNWHPLLEDTVARMRADGVRRALALVTSAYGGYSSCRQYQEDVAAARAKVGPGAPVIEKLRLYYNHPGWVSLWAQSLRRALGTAPTPEDDNGRLVLFSAHSIPAALARTSPYAQHVAETAGLVARAAGVQKWQLVWQSRSGSPGQPWLGPDITEVLAGTGARSVVVAPIGFVCDNMEIVHDLDVEAAAVARQKGAGFVRASTVCTTGGFASMVRQLVQERLDPGQAERASLGADGPWPDECPPGHCPSAAQLAGA